MKLVGSFVYADLGSSLDEHIACVKTLAHYHRGNTGLALALEYAPLNGAGTSVFWQQRSMDIYTICLRQVQYTLGKYLSVSHNHNKIGSKLFQRFICFLSVIALFKACRLIYGYILRDRIFLYRRRSELVASSLGLIGLRKYRRNVFAAFYQCFKAGNGKIGSSHKYNVHRGTAFQKTYSALFTLTLSFFLVLRSSCISSGCTNSSTISTKS